MAELRVFQALFKQFIKPFPENKTYFNDHKWRNGLYGEQLSKKHKLSKAQGMRLSYVFHYWLDIVEELNIADRLKKALTSCTYRFGVKETAGYCCHSKILCPWCRGYVVHNTLEWTRALSFPTVMKMKAQPVELKKKVFRPPRNTFCTVRNIYSTVDGFFAGAAFLCKATNGEAASTDWRPAVVNLLGFDVELLQSSAADYLKLMTGVKMVTKTDLVRKLHKVSGGWTYFIQASDGGPVKIGYSADPEGRLNKLSTASPYELRIIGVIDGNVEQILHQKFKADHIRLEWYASSCNLKEYIKNNAKAYVPPSYI